MAPKKEKISDVLLTEDTIINEEVMQFLKEHSAELTPEERYVIVTFNDYETAEMLPPGFHKADANAPINFIIICIVFIKSKKFQPVGVLFTHNRKRKVEPKEIADCIRLYVLALQKTCLKVVCTLSPPIETFRKVLSILVKLDNIETFNGKLEYKVGKQTDIIHIYDPPSMLKMFRDCFVHQDVEYRTNDKSFTATWRDIIQLYLRRELQHLEKEHISPHLKSHYTNYAAQIFSKHVSWTIIKTIKSGMLAERSTGTSLLLKMFNDLFDSLNSSSSDNCLTRRSVTKNSYHATFWEKAIKFLETLRFIERTHIKKKQQIYPYRKTNQMKSPQTKPFFPQLQKLDAISLGLMNKSLVYSNESKNILDDPMGDIDIDIPENYESISDTKDCSDLNKFEEKVKNSDKKLKNQLEKIKENVDDSFTNTYEDGIATKEGNSLLRSTSSIVQEQINLSSAVSSHVHDENTACDKKIPLDTIKEKFRNKKHPNLETDFSKLTLKANAMKSVENFQQLESFNFASNSNIAATQNSFYKNVFNEAMPTRCRITNRMKKHLAFKNVHLSVKSNNSNTEVSSCQINNPSQGINKPLKITPNDINGRLPIKESEVDESKLKTKFTEIVASPEVLDFSFTSNNINTDLGQNTLKKRTRKSNRKTIKNPILYDRKKSGNINKNTYENLQKSSELYNNRLELDLAKPLNHSEIPLEGAVGLESTVSSRTITCSSELNSSTKNLLIKNTKRDMESESEYNKRLKSECNSNRKTKKKKRNKLQNVKNEEKTVVDNIINSNDSILYRKDIENIRIKEKPICNASSDSKEESSKIYITEDLKKICGFQNSEIVNINLQVDVVAPNKIDQTDKPLSIFDLDDCSIIPSDYNQKNVISVPSSDFDTDSNGSLNESTNTTIKQILDRLEEANKKKKEVQFTYINREITNNWLSSIKGIKSICEKLQENGFKSIDTRVFNIDHIHALIFDIKKEINGIQIEDDYSFERVGFSVVNRYYASIAFKKGNVGIKT